jgi:hypothetical protein
MSCAIKLLAYCVISSQDQVATEGVRGAPVRSMNFETLRCIYSPLIPPQEFNQDDALRFHTVLNAVFQQQAIIPFRFPTLLQNETDLRAHLHEKFSVYSADLQRLADMVQMELRIAVKEERAAAKSGTEYLRSKQQQARSLQSLSQAAQALVESLVVQWKERPTDQGLRCYALVKRAEVPAFRQKLTGAEFSGSTKVLISGPWPATEFLDE